MSAYFSNSKKSRAVARKPRDAACFSYARDSLIVICFSLRKVKVAIALTVILSTKGRLNVKLQINKCNYWQHHGARVLKQSA